MSPFMPSTPVPGDALKSVRQHPLSAPVTFP
jgi:hypothetical protein